MLSVGTELELELNSWRTVDGRVWGGASWYFVDEFILQKEGIG